MTDPVALVILDGLGISDNKIGNAVSLANMPNYKKLLNKYPSTNIKASGLDVGLPEGQMGNSEVGHLNIGAGRIVYQELTRISQALRTGKFYKNNTLLNVMKHVKSNSKKLHLMGLVSDGGVHSHIDHILGLVDMAKEQGIQELYIHCFLDGRDTPPKSALKYIKQLEDKVTEVGLGQIATVSGRYYAMDRDTRWERTKQSFDAMVHGEGRKAQSATEAIEYAYEQGETDEFVKPTVIQIENDGMIDSNDGIIFFNFRPDRARQLTRALVDKKFADFERNIVNLDLHFVTMTLYDKNIQDVNIAYAPQTHKDTLGEYISNQGLKQLRIAETEKYAHVTYFFNGGIEKKYPNEDRKLVKSPDVATYDLKPEMSAKEVTDELTSLLSGNHYDLIVLNFANPDMVGHTGDLDAVIKALEVVDDCLGIVVDKITNLGGKLIITSDHGNAEEMINEEKGIKVTAHTTNPVPLILIDQEVKTLRSGGRLCDIAPTILDLMGLDKPGEMTGNSLILEKI
ncbi:2,3-bisphosphoglycerate-independent phosphoglycerate mutase [Serpentinicella sp. ANB-PHB4]|uniref:2,3-bisphosphoglycerate-independent phosphoglycerate mutase n=1 Tax=Serpentinicella sp. ANB-PHB4 TaxID=3074076 RepID=UPI00285D4FFC|nr:2,3-bisphosphoglycerate-independent phosphoglycerate mutase [Serpentinicella sp. ANB-PHB4]MDR5658970.1 2,3-bisphosphoglycerate-independent phosphoglycerate mutase [Serpentinicella sp. ANB-PHB4]